MNPGPDGGVRADIVLRERGLDVAVTIEPGECLALVGPNGAGKSTVVDVLAGLVRPDGGQVMIGGRTVSRGSRLLVPAHRRHVGLVGQDGALFPHLSVVQNVAYGPRSRGASGGDAGRRAAAALEMVGASSLAGRGPATLSGGQAQRVAVARAIATDPALVLLDEPTSALDVGVRPEVRAALRTALVGRTALLVTHDPIEVVALADQVAVLDGGRIVEQGPVDRVLARPTSRFGAALSGLVLLRGTATAAGIALDDVVDGPADGSADGTGADAARLGVRDPRRGGGELVSATGTVPPGRRVLGAYHPAAARLGRPEGADGLLRTITALEPRDGLVRVRAGDLVADVTLATLGALGIGAGDDVRIIVPPAEVTVYPDAGRDDPAAG